MAKPALIRGTIINVSSIGGRTAAPLASLYHANKFAVIDHLRVEHQDLILGAIEQDVAGCRVRQASS